MFGWVQVSLYITLCLGLLLVTVLVLVAALRGFQLQWLEVRFRRETARKNYEMALASIGQAIKLNPTNPHFYHQRAKLYAELGHLQMAEEDYTTGMRFSQSATAYAGRAAVRLQLALTKEALIDANHAIACSRLWWRGYYERGRVYAALGHYEVALDDFNQALELNRLPLPELYLARAEAASHLGDTEMAGRDRQRAAEISHR